MKKNTLTAAKSRRLSENTEFAERKEESFFLKKRIPFFSVTSVVRLFSVVLLSLLFISSAAAQPVAVSPQLLEKAIELFPGQPGPYELRFRTDIRMHELGFQVINYEMLAGGVAAGTVTRVMSVFPEGMAGDVDVLARFDDKGRILGLVSLKPWKEGKDETALGPLFSFFKGKDIMEYKDALSIFFNGLASGANMKDVKPLPPPPKDLVYNLEGKILLPGSTIPALKTKDIDGREFDTKKTSGKLIMVFASPECKACDDLIASLNRGLDLSGKRESVRTVYIIGGDDRSARGYIKRLGVKGTVIAEPEDHVSKPFKSPFKPYVLMFEGRTLKYNFLWEGDEAKLFGVLYLLIEGREPEGGEEV